MPHSAADGTELGAESQLVARADGDDWGGARRNNELCSVAVVVVERGRRRAQVRAERVGAAGGKQKQWTLRRTRRLDGSEAHAAGGRVDEHHVARLHASHEVHQLVRGQPCLRHRGRCAPREACWLGHDGGRVDGDVLGVAAAWNEREHLVARLEALGTCADGHDDARCFKPEDARDACGYRRLSLALHRVKAVDGGRDDTYEHLAGAGLWRRLALHDTRAVHSQHAFHCLRNVHHGYHVRRFVDLEECDDHDHREGHLKLRGRVRGGASVRGFTRCGGCVERAHLARVKLALATHRCEAILLFTVTWTSRRTLELRNQPINSKRILMQQRVHGLTPRRKLALRLVVGEVRFVPGRWVDLPGRHAILRPKK